MSCTHPHVAIDKRPETSMEFFRARYQGMSAICRVCGARLTIHVTEDHQKAHYKEDEPEGTTFSYKGDD